MFTCQITKKCSAPGEKPVKLVVEKREKNYFERRYVEDTDEFKFTQVGRGYEIVKELLVSREGYEAWLESGATVLVHPSRK